tara:strand:- start:1104 stop:1310 length:207 start_codon:yes stop_codon:yes gene_type:complete
MMITRKSFQVYVLLAVSIMLVLMGISFIKLEASLDRLSDQSIQQEKNIDILDAWLQQEFGNRGIRSGS